MADTLNPPAQEDRDTFLGAAIPEPMQRQAQITPAPEKPAAPAPEAPAPTPTPKVSSYMVGLASSLGLTPEEAQSFGSDAELSRALTLAARFRSAPQPASAPTPAPAAPSPQEEWAEIPELDDRYDPGLIALAKRARENDRYWKKQIEDLKKQLPEMVQKTYAQQTAAQQVTQLIGDAMQESGYDRATLNAETQRRIAEMGHALYQTYAKAGQKADEKLIVKAVLPLVLGQANPTKPPAVYDPATNTVSAVQPNSSLSVAIEAQRKAIAAQRERDEKGRYLPGTPTHRLSESNGVASALRSHLLDAGADPGEAPTKDDQSFFLK